jgi:hypothetical protein
MPDIFDLTAMLARELVRLVQADIDEDPLRFAPARTWEDLQGIVDANEYLIDADDALGTDFDMGDPTFHVIANTAQSLAEDVLWPPLDWPALLLAALREDEGVPVRQFGEWPTGGGTTALGAEVTVAAEQEPPMTVHVKLTDGNSQHPHYAVGVVTVHVADGGQYVAGVWIEAEAVPSFALKKLLPEMLRLLATERPVEVYLTESEWQPFVKGEADTLAIR